MVCLQSDGWGGGSKKEEEEEEEGEGRGEVGQKKRDREVLSLLSLCAKTTEGEREEVESGATSKFARFWQRGRKEERGKPKGRRRQSTRSIDGRGKGQKSLLLFCVRRTTTAAVFSFSPSLFLSFSFRPAIEWSFVLSLWRRTVVVIDKELFLLLLYLLLLLFPLLLDRPSPNPLFGRPPSSLSSLPFLSSSSRCFVSHCGSKAMNASLCSTY